MPDAMGPGALFPAHEWERLGRCVREGAVPLRALVDDLEQGRIAGLRPLDRNQKYWLTWAVRREAARRGFGVDYRDDDEGRRAYRRCGALAPEGEKEK